MNENVAFLCNFKFLKLLCLTIFAFTLLTANGIAGIPNLYNFKFNVSNATNYSSVQGYQFNVTFNNATNSTPLGPVWIEHNFTGILTNYTVTTANGNESFYNYSTLAAGFYYIKWYANDTSLILNNTDYVHYYQVNKSSPVLSLTLNGTAGNRSYLNNTAVNLGNTATPGYINSSLSFYYNTSASTAWNAIASPQNWNIASLPAGVYWVLMNFTGDQNYTNATSIRMLTLNDSRITFGNFTSNVSSLLNYSPSQGYQFNVTAFNSSQYNTVWIRANFSGAFVNYTATMYGVTQFNYTAGTLAAGSYTYTWCANNSLLAYFNSSNQTFQVNKSYIPMTLYINGTNVDRTLYNYSVANLTANFSSSYSFNITLWTNLTGSWTLLDNEPSPITNYTDLTPYRTRNYSVIANWTGNQNYTMSNATHNITLIDGTLPNIANLNQNVSNTTNYSAVQGYQFNATITDNAGLYWVKIEHNFSETLTNYTVSTVNGNEYFYNYSTLAAGFYQYRWYANDTNSNLNSTAIQYYQLNQDYLSITLYINGTNDDSTAYNYSVANFTANFSSSYSYAITLYTNLTGTMALWDTQNSPLTNYTDLTPYQAVNYSVIANWTGNANYTISSASHYLTLAYYTAPPTPPTGGTGGWNAPSGPSEGGQQSVIFMTIEAGVASIAKYTDKLLDVREINITVSNPANTVKITVSKVDEQPATITHEITGTVYKYFNITTQNLDESNVAKARLKFRVNKTWYSENNLSPATTKLNRYESSGWRTLSATQTTSDTDYYYFEAQTPGFSIFAVTATKTVQPAPTTCTNTCQPGQSQRAYPDCSCYTPAQPSGEGITPTAPNYNWLIFIMVVVIVTLVLVSMVKKRVKRTHKHHK